MKYYLHDSNSFDDEKIAELFIEHGYEGLGLFYTILEKIAAQEKPIKTSVLKSQLQVGKRLEKCWSFMEQIGLICSSNGETFNKQLMNFAESYKIKKEKNNKRISEWRENQSDTKNVTRSEQVGNAAKGIVIEDIVIKEKEKKEMSASENEFEVFKDWIVKNAKTVSQMREPFTLEQFLKLKDDFPQDFSKSLLLEMHNYAKLKTNNISANLTFRKWAAKNAPAKNGIGDLSAKDQQKIFG